MKNLSIIVCIALLIFSVSCSEDGVSEDGDNYDRQAMLANWADNIIIPAYEDYQTKLEAMDQEVTSFTNAPSTENLTSLRSAWLDAYIAWQSVGMFEIGRAESITLLNFTNIYPLAADQMTQTLESGSYDLTSVNRQDEQGFPAIDYLLHGVAASDQEIVDVYNNEQSGGLYKSYLVDLSNRLESLASSVLTDWKNGYRDTFVANDGSDATSSVNKLVNDYLFYYEKHLRAGKIGIPAGVFSNSTLSDQVEAYYSGHSKTLFMAGLDAMQDFFNGVHFDGSEDGESLRDYLEFLNTITDGEDVASLIDSQFNFARGLADDLDDDFSLQVESDNTKMLQTYDALQQNVVYLKVDMLQAMSIKVDFVDADGD